MKSKRKFLRIGNSRLSCTYHSDTLLSNSIAIQKLLKKENPTVLEIGCNDGLDSVELLTSFPAITLHCFDPEPRAIKTWKETVPSKATDKQICALHEIALSDKTGTSTFYQSGGTTENAYKKDWDLSGSLNVPTGHLQYSPWVTFKTTIEVQTDTLDNFIDRFNKANNLIPIRSIDLIWMDVQGGERNVLRGATNTLKKTKYVYTEFNHRPKPLYQGQMNLEQTLKALPGWALVGVYERMNVLMRNQAIK